MCTLKTLSHTQLRVWDGAGRSADKASTMQENLQARGSELGLQQDSRFFVNVDLDPDPVHQSRESEPLMMLRKGNLCVQDKAIKALS